MPDFDEQWKKDLGKEYFQKEGDQFDFNEKNIERFKKLTGIGDSNKNNNLNEKICLDAGCGTGRWTYAMQQLGSKRVR